MPSRGTATGAWLDQWRNQKSREHHSFAMPEGHFRLLAIPRHCWKPCNISAAGIDATGRARRRSKNLFTNSSKKSAEKSSKKRSIGFLVRC